MSPESDVKILLVDDRPENLLALSEVLAPIGHTIVQAHSGEEALKCLLQQDFAVIVLDVQMPTLDGFETAQLIRGRDRSRDTPIIFLTAVNTSDQHVFRGYALGAVDYLLKPVVPEILLSKVSVLVDLDRKTAKVRRQAEELAASVQALEHEISERRRTEEELRRARDELEERVRERTAGLTAANQALLAEMAERRRVEAERERLLEREQQARAEAEAAVRLRDQFLTIASHELKTPLTSLFGNVQLLRRRLPKTEGLDERIGRLVNVVEQQATRLNRLVDALLDISRIHTGQLTITRQSVDLCALTARVTREVQLTLERHTLVVNCPHEPLIVNGDSLRLEQVLFNIIHNAVKYSPQGGMIGVRVESHESHVTLAVTDQGIGIPADSLPHVFQRFYRADNADTHRISGMGVGLYVVKEIVALHGGHIEVESSEGSGTTFTVYLPQSVLVLEGASRRT